MKFQFMRINRMVLFKIKVYLKCVFVLFLKSQLHVERFKCVFIIIIFIILLTRKRRYWTMLNYVNHIWNIDDYGSALVPHFFYTLMCKMYDFICNFKHYSVKFTPKPVKVSQKNCIIDLWLEFYASHFLKMYSK